MKKEKSHGRDEADCRAELILFDRDCTDPTKDTAALLLEASGKPSTPGKWDWGVQAVCCWGQDVPQLYSA